MSLLNSVRKDRRQHSLVLLPLLLVVPGCITGRGGGQGRDSTTIAVTPSRPVPTGNCRVVGRLIAVDSNLISNDTADPCSINPCRGVVSIENVVGIGPDFPDYLVRPGDRVVATFPGSFLAYDERFNGMLVKSLPGLPIGTRFMADMALESTNGRDDDRASDGSLTVYSYQVLEND